MQRWPSWPHFPAAAARPGTTTTAAAAVDLRAASSSAGNIVVDSAGMSLYFFTKDVKDSGTSACTGECLTAWPPLLTTAGTPAGEMIRTASSGY
ncbi:hypothetical protein [Pseudarthrobacter sp. AL20]|uniref:hypothetical protein n=1 Tax=unclassified Pseudarthrobacter TaxID=2647000 RepID=UPI0032B733AF